MLASLFATALLGLMLAAMLAACAPTVNTQGQILLPSRVAQLQPNVSTKDDVQALLGTPSLRGTMNDQRWYYLTATTQSRVLQAPELLNRTVMVLDFNPSGTLTGITQRSQTDGKAIVPDAETTRTEGQSLGILDQAVETFTNTFKR
jgi:outer membrane protein assembly factor BamE (lipoprotein component of BamABCDE complex)